MKTPIYYGERRNTSPFCLTSLPTLAVSLLLENAALRRRIRPQILCGFWSTFLYLEPVAFILKSFQHLLLFQIFWQFNRLTILGKPFEILSNFQEGSRCLQNAVKLSRFIIDSQIFAILQNFNITYYYIILHNIASDSKITPFFTHSKNLIHWKFLRQFIENVFGVSVSKCGIWKGNS